MVSLNAEILKDVIVQVDVLDLKAPNDDDVTTFADDFISNGVKGKQNSCVERTFLTLNRLTTYHQSVLDESSFVVNSIQSDYETFSTPHVVVPHPHVFLSSTKSEREMAMKSF